MNSIERLYEIEQEIARIELQEKEDEKELKLNEKFRLNGWLNRKGGKYETGNIEWSKGTGTTIV